MTFIETLETVKKIKDVVVEDYHEEEGIIWAEVNSEDAIDALKENHNIVGVYWEADDEPLIIQVRT